MATACLEQGVKQRLRVRVRTNQWICGQCCARVGAIPAARRADGEALVRLDPADQVSHLVEERHLLAGGIFRAEDAEFIDRLANAVHRIAPAARLIPLRTPPVVGAALLGLEELGDRLRPAALRRLRESFATQEG